MVTTFEKQWRKKYSEAAQRGGSDHQISLWSREGLEAYLQYFSVYFKPYIKKDNSQTLVLDLGCGPGTFSRWLAQRGFQVYGLDYSPEMIQIAKKRSAKGKINYLVADIYNLPFPDNFFDIIICLGVFQTLDHPKQALVEIESKLKPGGTLILTALNCFSVFPRKKADLPLRRFNPFAFRRWLTGFAQIKLKGMFFFPPKGSALTSFILRYRIYKFFNLFFPLFCFLSHSFYLEARKKYERQNYFNL